VLSNEEKLIFSLIKTTYAGSTVLKENFENSLLISSTDRFWQ